MFSMVYNKDVFVIDVVFCMDILFFLFFNSSDCDIVSVASYVFGFAYVFKNLLYLCCFCFFLNVNGLIIFVIMILFFGV